jgi:hypothetical protein
MLLERMVVVEQQIGGPEGVRVETRTIDGRLSIADGAWRLEDVASYGGDPVARPPNLSSEALAVLAHPDIAIPDSARWDIYSGAVSNTVLGLMSRLADRVPIGVVSLVAGHPWEIFGTDRQSDHTRGVAVDIYAVGNRLIVEDRTKGSESYRAAQWFSRQPEVARLGSPWRFVGATAITLGTHSTRITCTLQFRGVPSETTSARLVFDHTPWNMQHGRLSRTACQHQTSRFSANDKSDGITSPCFSGGAGHCGAAGFGELESWLQRPLWGGAYQPSVR